MTLPFTHIRHMIASGVGVAFILSVIVALFVMPPVFRSSTASTIEFADNGYPLGRVSRQEAVGLARHVLVLPRFSWSDQTKGAEPIVLTIVPILAIKNPEQARRICDYSPNMVRTIKEVLEHTAYTTDLDAPGTLHEAGQSAVEAINLGLGTVWLRTIHLLHNVDAALMVSAERCQVLKP